MHQSMQGKNVALLSIDAVAGAGNTMLRPVKVHRKRSATEERLARVPLVRVLVVEDHEQFQQFICTTLETSPELQVIGRVSDGLDAVQRAEELQPDLIVLDIGLPTLSGIEAARGSESSLRGRK